MESSSCIHVAKARGGGGGVPYFFHWLFLGRETFLVVLDFPSSAFNLHLTIMNSFKITMFIIRRKTIWFQMYPAATYCHKRTQGFVKMKES